MIQGPVSLLETPDAPKEGSSAKTLYNRWQRWSDNGVFPRIMVEVARRAQDDHDRRDIAQGPPDGVEP